MTVADIEAVLVEMRQRRSDRDGGLMSDLIKQEKQVRRGRLASAMAPIPLAPGGILQCADLMSGRNA
jgi:hypothetical protein